MRRPSPAWPLLLLLPLALSAGLAGRSRADAASEERAAAALRKAAGYFTSQVSVGGSYLWSYSEDLKTRRGETEATATQGWVQPPGTPAVGMALLRAHAATGERAYLDGAAAAARALARTQLGSGGWDYVIELDPEQAKRWHYRRDVEAGDRDTGTRRNTSTFDDNNSQSALRFLMRADAALEGKDAGIRRAVDYGLEQLLAARCPNGAWPQRWDGKPRDAAAYPVLSARYPEEWPRTWPGTRYYDFYTFNDNAIRDVVLTLLEAHRRYSKPEYLEAARAAGGFILRAQLPDPQPVWAQQYNLKMEPAWARKFEPPSATAGESVGVIRTLLDLYLYTGDAQYLKPIPPAVAWFRRSRLPGGERWARFYELKTNRPLYFTRQYELVYTDNDLPTHYSFQSEYGAPGMIAYYERVVGEGREAFRAREARMPDAAALSRRARDLEPRAAEAVSALDERGRWLEGGQLRSATFIRNAGVLAEYLAAARGRPLPPDDGLGR